MSSECPTSGSDLPEPSVPAPAEAPPAPRRLLDRVADAVRAAHREGVPL